VILDRNWRSGRLELDIVARDGATVVFVEVKARRPGPQPAAEAVTPRKRRNLRRAARDWIHAHPHTGGEYRFDVVAVTLRSGRQPLIRHIRDAFTGDDV
jgi:putative endonuclease